MRKPRRLDPRVPPFVLQYGQPLTPNVNPPDLSGREACPFWNLNLATYMEMVAGYDVSQFDYEWASQFTLREFWCLGLSDAQNDFQPGDMWTITVNNTEVLEWPMSSPLWSSWRYVMIMYIEYLLSIQNPYPVDDILVSGLINPGSTGGITDINGDGYIDQFDLDHFYCFSCN